MDLNKTKLTHTLTAAAGVWLSNMCARPAVTELTVKGYGVADLGALLSMNQSTARRLRVPWRDWHSCIIEVKSTRSDYQRDRKFRQQAAANLQILVTPKGLVRANEAAGWGILEPWGTGLRMRRLPKRHDIPIDARMDFLLGMISAMHWRKLNAAHRAYRIEANKLAEGHKAVTSWSTAAWRITRYLKSPDDRPPQTYGIPGTLGESLEPLRRAIQGAQKPKGETDATDKTTDRK